MPRTSLVDSVFVALIFVLANGIHAQDANQLTIQDFTEGDVVPAEANMIGIWGQLVCAAGFTVTDWSRPMRDRSPSPLLTTDH